MVTGSSRRRVLLLVGALSAGVAGCMDDELSDEPDGDDDTEPPADDDSSDTAGPSTADEDGTTADEDGTTPDDTATDDRTDPTDGNVDPGSIKYPAIEIGELVSDFGPDARLEALHGTFEGDTEQARIGEQAMVIENGGDRAGVGLHFPEGLDLDGWDTSLAVKAGAINRIAIEFHAPSFGDHLTSFRRLPNDHDDWLRIDFGFDEKQGDPDLSHVTELRILGFASGDGPTRFVIDDLRRTPAVANGKAILACYGGRLSHYEIAGELLQERGWPAAVAVDPRDIGRSGRMDVQQLRELQERGWDICPAPSGPDGLSGRPEDEQRSIIETAQEALSNRGFDNGARHFFAPAWREMDPTNHKLVREHFDTAFVFGSSTSGIPPTGSHLIPMSWGPALHGGVRRQINLADQYQQLVVLRIPSIVENEDNVTDNNMWVEDFIHLLDHLEHRGLDVITPTDLIDGTFEDDDTQPESIERPDGMILEAGARHSFDGEGHDTTDEFELEDGLLHLSYAHDADGLFSIDVVGQDNNPSFVNIEDVSEGESVMVVDAGTYHFEISAEGPWTIRVRQPEVHSDDLTDVPLGATGSGPRVIGPIWAAERGRLQATHEGSGPFVVDLTGVDGTQERIVHSTGSFDSSRSYRGPGTCWLAVKAAGDWSIEME